MPRACPCHDYSRTELVRRAVASAGTGLPAIESGMPIPAGTGLSRRRFVAQSFGLALAVYGGSRLSAAYLDDGIAEAAALAGPKDPVLISVFMDGGADSISVLFPNGDPRYRALRPKLALPASQGIAFPDDARLLWHPAAAGLATLRSEGKLAVMPAVGYDHPDKSHFTSRHYWEVGATQAGMLTGWMGRLVDAIGKPDNPLQGLALDTKLMPALATARMPIASLDSPDTYTFSATPAQALPLERQMLVVSGSLGATHSKSKDPALRQAGQAALAVNRLRGDLRPFTGADGQSTIRSPVAYPVSAREQFPRRLAGLAAMLAAGLPVRCVSIRAPGMYDTHNDQANDLSEGLKLTADSLLAFQRDIEARGVADRVLVHVWSEFGRRGRENGSLGTDHGAAGIGFLIGSRVRAGMIGEFPGLAGGLDSEGNLRATSDFRGVYAAIIEQWFGQDASRVIPNAKSFARPAILR
jgi:uncharacterized protein (DUF1501 family)